MNTLTKNSKNRRKYCLRGRPPILVNVPKSCGTHLNRRLGR